MWCSSSIWDIYLHIGTFRALKWRGMSNWVHVWMWWRVLYFTKRHSTAGDKTWPFHPHQPWLNVEQIISNVFFSYFLRGWENIILSKYFSNISKKAWTKWCAHDFLHFVQDYLERENAQRLDCSSSAPSQSFAFTFLCSLEWGKGKIVFAGRGGYIQLFHEIWDLSFSFILGSCYFLFRK